MKSLIHAIVLGLALGSAALVHAADAPKAASPAQKAQQEKMKSCNQEAKAKDLKGDERKAFMKNCLSAKPAPAAEAGAGGPREKMKSCNQEASDKGLKGAPRKAFMSDCLKN
jgi:hypothetical protein